MLGRNDALALAAVTRGNREQVVTDDQLKAVRAPLLAVVGSADPGLPGVQALKTLLPVLQMVVVEGASHGGERGRGPERKLVARVPPGYTHAVRQEIVTCDFSSVSERQFLSSHAHLSEVSQKTPWVGWRGSC